MCFLENTHDEGEVRILLVEHHTAVREAIAFAFERGAGFEVVAQAASLSEARGMVERIDVAVVDHGLPDGYGCDLIKDLKETNSQAQVFETVGIGGLVPRTDKEILEVVRALNKERSNRGAEPWIHLFGVYRPKIHRQLREFGATSFDSATYFRKAWLRSDQNYLDPDGRSWHAAIRIPMTSDPRTRNRLRRVMHNHSDQKVGQVAQRSPELVVESLPAGVGRHLGRQAGQ